MKNNDDGLERQEVVEVMRNNQTIYTNGERDEWILDGNQKYSVE